MSHSSNSEEASCLASEMRAINQSHTHLEQNQKLMESNSEIMKQVLQLSKDLQEIKLQLAKALNQAPVTPAPATPANQGVTGTPSPAAPQATSSPQLPQQSPQQPQQQTHQLASRQTEAMKSSSESGTASSTVQPNSKSEEPVTSDPNLSSALADAMKSSSESGTASSTVQPNSTSGELVIRSSVPNLSSTRADAIKSSAESDAASSTVQAIGGEVNPEEERDIHFQPIIKLPEKVDLVTGEEQEVAEFVGRGKLYHFDGGAKQWKERGVGDIKIMKDEDRDVYRIVMRRDQIHKVCANHYIMSSMVLHPMSGSDRAWVWHAMDAADGEPTSEQLALKFKEPSIATAFKKKFEEAQAKIRLREAASRDDTQKGSQEDGDATASGTASSTTSQKGDGVATAIPSIQDSTSKERMIRSRVPNLSSALADAIKSSAESDAVSSTVQAIGGEVNPEEERDIHFQPIVRLPEKVDLVTGEEQEVAEFVGRGKLYRFDGGAKQWKERGVGDIKIMKDENRDVYRIVMRRDQIHEKDLQEIKIQQAKALNQAPVTPAPATPANQVMTGTPSPAPQATSSPQLPQQSPQQPQQQTHQRASRQTASPSIQQTPRSLYQPHPTYHPLESAAYYQHHMIPPSPMGAGTQSWYPSAYGMPSPMANTAYYAQQGYAMPAYERNSIHPGMMASTPRTNGRGPLESLYGMYSSIGASPEEKGSAEQLAGLQSLKAHTESSIATAFKEKFEEAQAKIRLQEAGDIQK